MTAKVERWSTVKGAIFAQMRNLSGRERQIAEFTLKNYRECSMMGIGDLANASGASSATVSRYTHSLGFDGYHDYIECLRKELSPSNSLKLLQENLSAGSPEEALSLSLLEDIDQVQRLADGFDPTVFASAVKAIIEARRVFVLGLGSSRYIAGYFVFNLQGLGFDVVDLGAETGIEGIARRLVQLSSSDMLLSIAFPRFSALTMEVAEAAERADCKIVSVTSSLTTSLANASDIVLCAPSRQGLHSGSGVSAMAVMEALLTALTALAPNAQEAANTLSRLIDHHLVS